MPSNTTLITISDNHLREGTFALHPKTTRIRPGEINIFSKTKKLRCLEYTPSESHTLRSVTLNGCTGLTALPEGLKMEGGLSLNGCTGLTALPEGLKMEGGLSLIGCTGLTTLPADLRVGETINLNGCTSLIPTPELIEQLKTHEEKYVGPYQAVVWPEHFNYTSLIADARNRFSKTIAEYKKTQPAGAPMVAKLFQRFTSEDLDQRGGADEVAASTEPFLTALAENPQHLTWMEPIATEYVSYGCINQPVAGFSQLNAWISVVQEPTIGGKLEAARQLMALDTIRSAAAKSSSKLGSTFEVDAGNMLERTVHEKLVRDGMKEWLGVPGPVVYESLVEEWVNKNTEPTAKEVKAVMKTPLTEVGQYVIDKHGDTWAAIAFPQEKSDIEAQYAPGRKALQTLFSDTSQPYQASAETKLDDAVTAHIISYEKKLAGKTPEERTTILTEFFQNLDCECTSKIGQITRELTEEAAKSSFTAKEKDRRSGQTRTGCVIS